MLTHFQRHMLVKGCGKAAEAAEEAAKAEAAANGTSSPSKDEDSKPITNGH
jgi:hypothetical protein